MNGPVYLTVREAAVVLRMRNPESANTARTIRRWVRTGRLKCGRVGRTPVFSREQLDNFVFQSCRAGREGLCLR